jgi:hypothetical protein
LSTDAAGAVSAPSRRRGQLLDLRAIRVLRFAIGVTLAAGVSFAFEWPLYFLCPIFTAVFLAQALPNPASTLKDALLNGWYVIEGFAIGLLFTLFLLPFPGLYVLALGLVLFHIFYRLNRGDSFWRVLMHLLAVLILPMLGQMHDAMSIGFAANFAFSGILAILFVMVAYALFPDPPEQASAPRRPPVTTGYVPTAAAAALKTTLVVVPLAVFMIALEWTSEVLVMTFVAVFALSPRLEHGLTEGLNSLKSTLLGGIAALVVYWLLVAVPEFHFFVALMLFVALVFGRGIFSAHPLAKYLTSALIVVLVLIGGSTGEGKDIVEKLVTRILLISAAVIYIVSAFAVLERFVFRPTR